MNSRKTTKIVETITRQLKGSYLKSPPPAYFPILAHPPSPSLVRFLAPRPESDLPPSSLRQLTLEQIKFNKLKLKKQTKKLSGTLTNLEQSYLRSPLSNLNSSTSTTLKPTRRPPPRVANSRNNKPLPIVFPEDQIRLQFFRDHPFEAFRPINLVENEFIKDVEGPEGKDWTELSQRSKIPNAEDAIAFTHNLNTTFSIPLSQAYSTSINQFRTLRSSHENSLRSATMEAKSHGAIFFGEIERGLRVEERILDEWKYARDVQNKIAASRPGMNIGNNSSSSSNSSPDISFLGGTGLMIESEKIEDSKVEFTGGINYVQRFNDMMESFEEEVNSIQSPVVEDFTTTREEIKEVVQ